MKKSFFYGLLLIALLTLCACTNQKSTNENYKEKQPENTISSSGLIENKNNTASDSLDVIYEDEYIRLSEYKDLTVLYHEPELKDTDSYINEILTNIADEGEIPEATDEYVTSHFDNVSSFEELEKLAQDSVNKYNETILNFQKAAALMDVVTDNSELLSYDQQLYDKNAEYLMSELTAIAERNACSSAAEYVQLMYGIDINDYIDQTVKRWILQRYIMNTIIQIEDIYPTDDEVNEQLTMDKNTQFEDMKYNMSVQLLETYLIEHNQFITPNTGEETKK